MIDDNPYLPLKYVIKIFHLGKNSHTHFQVPSPHLLLTIFLIQQLQPHHPSIHPATSKFFLLQNNNGKPPPHPLECLPRRIPCQFFNAIGNCYWFGSRVLSRAEEYFVIVGFRLLYSSLPRRLYQVKSKSRPLPAQSFFLFAWHCAHVNSEGVNLVLNYIEPQLIETFRFCLGLKVKIPAA